MKYIALTLLLVATFSSVFGTNDSNCDVDFKTWNETYYPAVCKPQDWICFTTAGG